MLKLNDKELTGYQPQANINVFRADTGEVLYSEHNVICNTVKWLFARLMANTFLNEPQIPYVQGHETLYGVWGLAFGSGSPTWPAETQPTETPQQTGLIAEFLRKPLSKISFVNTTFDPVTTLSTRVDFQTTVNATTDNIAQGIREMGLIGGGTYGSNPPATKTNMTTAPYFTGSTSDYNTIEESMDTVTLINYKTLPPLTLPQNVDIIFSWILSF